MIDSVVFYLFAALAAGSALVVVGQRNPLYSALALIVTMGALSAIFRMLGSTFIAALQVVVYAGAIMVLFLFVIMLLNVKREDGEASQSPGLRTAAVVLGAVFLVQAGRALWTWRVAAPAGFDASTVRVAQALFSSRYLYVFEATSVLILAALVGAVALAKRER